MAKQSVDILVAGGGIAGQIATLGFAHAGYSVICVDPMPSGPEDLRSTAFLNPGTAFLEDIGVFDQLRDFAAPLRVMRLCDAGGVENTIRETANFDAGDLGAAQFGWNVPNAPLRAALDKRIAQVKGAKFVRGVAVQNITPRRHDSITRLSDGRHIAARLVIAADGRDSPLRQAAGIATRRTRYGQKAMVFHVTHILPHEGVSTELHRTGGPFTLVPLADPHKSAVVWMDTNKDAARLMALDNDAFTRAAQDRSCDVLGTLELASARATFSIISQAAHRLAGDRMALVAEAAHVVPPIGAQGLNMSLTDISTLLIEAQKGDDPGEARALDAYQRQRLPDIALRVAGIDALNRAALAGNQQLRDIRAQGLKLLGGTRPLKGLAMRTGLG